MPKRLPAEVASDLSKRRTFWLQVPPLQERHGVVQIVEPVERRKPARGEFCIGPEQRISRRKLGRMRGDIGMHRIDLARGQHIIGNNGDVDVTVARTVAAVREAADEIDTGKPFSQAMVPQRGYAVDEGDHASFDGPVSRRRQYSAPLHRRLTLHARTEETARLTIPAMTRPKHPSLGKLGVVRSAVTGANLIARARSRTPADADLQGIFRGARVRHSTTSITLRREPPPPIARAKR